jgi:FG-GAP repeat
MVKSLIRTTPRQPGMAEARRTGGAHEMFRWPAALALLVAGCGSTPPPADPDAGAAPPDARIGPPEDGGQPPDAIDPNRPDAGPPEGFDYPTPLTASNGAALNWFGYSVAADDNVIVVGAPFYDEASGGQIVDPSIGSAYVFERIGDTWLQTTQFLSSASVRTSSMFGWSVAVDGNLIAVGAWNEDIPGDQFGAVYVYERVGGAWTQNAKLVPLSGDEQERFGHSVAISGSRIAVGAPFISDVDDSAEATPAYVFERNGTNWIGTSLQPSDNPRDSWFGYSVAISGNVAVVGAPGDKKRALGAGAAYVFESNGASWSQTARLEDAEGGVEDFMGRDVAVDGDVIVVGAEAGGDPTSLNTGIALVYERPAGTWVESARLVPEGAAVGTQIGYAVDVRGSTIVVGAHHDDHFGTDSGAAYVFEKDTASGWLQISKLYNQGSKGGDHFGAAAGIASDTTIAVGARYDDDDGYDSGSIYVFEASP